MGDQSHAYGGGFAAVYAAVANGMPCTVSFESLINEWEQGVDYTTVQTDLQNMITGAQTAGCDVILKTPIPSPTSVAAQYGSGATLTITPSGGSLSTCAVATPGSGYAASPVPAVILKGGGGSGGTASVTIANGQVSACTASGGTGYTSNPLATVDTQQAYVNIMRALATTNHNSGALTLPLPVSDDFAAWGSQAQQVNNFGTNGAAGWYATSNGLHANYLGYQASANLEEATVYGGRPGSPLGQNGVPYPTTATPPLRQRWVTASTTVLPSDQDLFISGAGITITMPSNAVPGQPVDLINWGLSAVTVAGFTGGNISPIIAPRTSQWVEASSSPGSWFQKVSPNNIGNQTIVGTNYTALQSDQIIYMSGTGLALTLPSLYAGTFFSVKNGNASHAVTINATTGGDFTSGGTLAAGQGMLIWTSGSDYWYIIANYTLSTSSTQPPTCADSSGSGVSQSCTPSSSVGSCMYYTTTTANTGGALTINVGGAGAVSVGKLPGNTTTLAVGDMPANTPVLVCGEPASSPTEWVMQSVANAPSGIVGVMPQIQQTPSLVEWMSPTTSGTMANVAGATSFSLCPSAGTSAAQYATATSPLMAQNASGGASGDCAGFYTVNTNVIYYDGGSPKVYFGLGFSAAADYNTTARIWAGLIGSSCTLATMIASDNPACSYAAIRYSTTASDTTWECVVNNGGTQVVAAIGSQVPTTAYTPMSVAVTPSAVTCTVNGVSNTPITTSLPASSVLFYDIFTDTETSGTTATHLRLSQVQGYHLNRAY
jgi:hypothetical protein